MNSVKNAVKKAVKNSEVKVDWEKFSFDYKLDSVAVPELISIEAYRESAVNLVLPPDWKAQLDRLNRVRAVHGTTALEGNPLSEAEVSQQIDELQQANGQAVGKLTKEQLQIRNAGLAQEWARKRFYPGSLPLCSFDVLNLHEVTTQHSDTTNNIPGKFRTFSVVVGSPEMGGIHRGAPHDQIERLMHEFSDFVNSRRLLDTHPVIRALLSHFFLVTIHPFGDGNGRVSRLIEAGILFQGGYNVHGFYGLSNYFYRNEAEYKTLLQRCRGSQPFDVTPFVNFGLVGFAKELRGINNFIKTKLNRVVYRDMLVTAYNKKTSKRRRTINEREWNLLTFLIKETEPNDPFSDSPSRKIKLIELRELPYIRGAYRKVTDRTFVRELMRLNDMGFITFRLEENEWIIELNFDAIGKY